MKCYLKTDIAGVYEYRLFSEKGLINWINSEIHQNDSNEKSIVTNIEEAISIATEMFGFGITEMKVED